MHIDGSLTEVEINQALLELANTADGALENLLDEDTLLWVHDLIVTLLKLAIDLDVLDVQDSVVGKLFFKSPIFDILQHIKKIVSFEIHAG